MRDNDEKKLCWSYAWWKEGTFKERTTKEKKEKQNSRENARKKERKLGDIASGMMRKNKFEKIIRKKR